MLRDNLQDALARSCCAVWAAQVVKHVRPLGLSSRFAHDGTVLINNSSIRCHGTDRYHELWQGLHACPKSAPSKHRMQRTHITSGTASLAGLTKRPATGRGGALLHIKVLAEAKLLAVSQIHLCVCLHCVTVNDVIPSFTKQEPETWWNPSKRYSRIIVNAKTIMQAICQRSKKFRNVCFCL